MGIGAALLIGALLLQSPGSLKKDFLAELRKIPSKTYFWLSFLLTCTCALSLFCAQIWPLGYGGHFVHPDWKDLGKAWYLFWPLLLTVGLRRLSPQQRKGVFYAWIFAFAVFSVLGILQYFTGWPRAQSIPGEDFHYHATLFLGHHLSVASIFIFPFFAALEATQFKKIKNRPLFALAALLGLMTLFLTYSRTLWIALPVGILIWAIWALPPRWKLPCVAITLLAMLALHQYAPFRSRLYQSMGVHTRTDLWLANLEFFKQRPITGVGWRHTIDLSGYYLMQKWNVSDIFSGHAHNNFLEMLGGTGLLGTTAWLAWCLGVIGILFQKRNQQKELPFSRGLLCAWIVFHLNGLTQVNIWEGKVEHQMAWVIAWSLL